MTARQYLTEEVAAALADGATGEELVDLIIRTGWQPRPAPDPNSDYVEGVLDSGRRVTVEIRHAFHDRVH